ncbi:hypothetical protein NEAUS06_1656 [Nematocida ausubeli]|nr:hypothetical protein NEAUS06_1656 [Nematocida ausubeli]
MNKFLRKITGRETLADHASGAANIIKKECVSAVNQTGDVLEYIGSEVSDTFYSWKYKSARSRQQSKRKVSPVDTQGMQTYADVVARKNTAAAGLSAGKESVIRKEHLTQEENAKLGLAIVTGALAIFIALIYIIQRKLRTRSCKL